MDRQITRLKKRLVKKAKRGIRGYPVGTLNCYGPDDRRASKLVAAIVEHEGGGATEMSVPGGKVDVICTKADITS